MNKDKQNKECCKKCYDVYYEKDYPMHTAINSCTNTLCPCHSPTEPEDQKKGLPKIEGAKPRTKEEVDRIVAPFEKFLDQKKDSWEEEFDDKFSKLIAEMLDYGLEIKDFHQKIKSFISQQLTKVKQQTIAEIVEKIEGMKKPLATKYRANFTEDERVGWWQIKKYNQALEDLKTLLKQKIN